MKKIVVVGLLMVSFFAGKAQSIKFSGSICNERINLNWSIDSNEATYMFEVERSFDGTSFSLAALVFTSEKKGKDEYRFFESMKSTAKVYYRIKKYSNNGEINYSNMICLTVKNEEKQTE